MYSCYPHLNVLPLLLELQIGCQRIARVSEINHLIETVCGALHIRNSRSQRYLAYLRR